jgi:glycosyltransferase involved in cell wall biosynthesis
MMAGAEGQPLVGIVTPVFNGEAFLAECIESVCSQTYQNWRYTIVDNCSTDGTRAIAERFAKVDSRISVVANERFAGLIENHNIAFRTAPDAARYVKLVSADDWLYPECLDKLVAAAERSPSAGVVGSYSISRLGIKWTGIGPDRHTFEGLEICRRFLIGEIDTFWVPSTVLYRADLVRSRKDFYPGAAPSADLSACLECLLHTDFEFVHQILSFERIHEAADTARVKREATYLLDRLEILHEIGPRVLTSAEFREASEAVLRRYYACVLAPAVFDGRPREFWRLHRRRLESLGQPLFGARFAKAVAARVLDLALNPKRSCERFIRRYRSPQPQVVGPVGRL